MLRSKKGGFFLLAGLAAFAYYKYSKLSENEKQDLTGTIREKGRKLYDQYVPEDIRNAFNKNSRASQPDFGEHSDYSV